MTRCSFTLLFISAFVWFSKDNFKVPAFRCQMTRVYVGNLGNNGSRRELEREFERFGPLRDVWVARNPPGFAFVLFEDTRDAEDACHEMDGKYVCGEKVRVEMARGPTRGGRAQRLGLMEKCYECGRAGHYARQCTRRPGGSRDRDRDRRRRSRSRSRSRSPRRRRSRSRSKSRSPRKRSRSNEDKKSRSRSKSHSKSRSRSRSESKERSNKERSASPDNSRDKDRDEHQDEKEATPQEETDKAAEEEHRSRSASPVPQDEEHQTNGDDAE